MPIELPPETVHGDFCVHKRSCYHSYREWVIGVSPYILWFYIKDVGDYQGNVFGVGLYKEQIAIYEDTYGSCSGCGAWGEGGEPDSQESVIARCLLFSTPKEAIKYVVEQLSDKYYTPPYEEFVAAINEAGRWP